MFYSKDDLERATPLERAFMKEINDHVDEKDALRARVAELEAALLSIENGCTVTADWEIEDHVRDVIEACRCTARAALAATDADAKGATE